MPLEVSITNEWMFFSKASAHASTVALISDDGDLVGHHPLIHTKKNHHQIHDNPNKPNRKCFGCKQTSYLVFSIRPLSLSGSDQISRRLSLLPSCFPLPHQNVAPQHLRGNHEVSVLHGSACLHLSSRRL